MRLTVLIIFYVLSSASNTEWKKLIAFSSPTGDDDWDSDGEKSASDLVTSPRSDQSPSRGEGVTSSPLSNQSENAAGAEVPGDDGASSGAASPLGSDLKETVDATVRNLTDRWVLTVS